MKVTQSNNAHHQQQKAAPSSSQNNTKLKKASGTKSATKSRKLSKCFYLASAGRHKMTKNKLAYPHHTAPEL